MPMDLRPDPHDADSGEAVVAIAANGPAAPPAAGLMVTDEHGVSESLSAAERVAQVGAIEPRLKVARKISIVIRPYLVRILGS